MNTCLFIGSKSSGVSCLKKMYELSPESLCAVVTVDDQNDTRTRYDDIACFARERVPFHVVGSNEEVETIIRKYNPSLVFVCGWYSLFSKNVMCLPPQGFCGFHFSLLPQYRGHAPLVWAMIQGETQVGLSLFRFNSGMDTGDIYIQESVHVQETDYIADVLERVEQKAVQALSRCYLDILSGRLVPTPQNHSAASYAAPRCPEDGKIDWHQPQDAIYNFIRAQSSPYTGAFTCLGSHTIRIWRAEKIARRYYCTPGQIAGFHQKQPLVGCGDNKVLCLTQTSSLSDYKLTLQTRFC